MFGTVPGATRGVGYGVCVWSEGVQAEARPRPGRGTDFAVQAVRCRKRATTVDGRRLRNERDPSGSQARARLFSTIPEVPKYASHCL